MSPKLTVLFATTRTKYFMEALVSVLNQSYKDFIVIVSDNTIDAKVLNKFSSSLKDSRIKWVHAYPFTGGDPVAHGKFLLKLVETEYFKFMFDDDVLTNKSFMHLIDLMKLQPGMAFHSRYMIGESNGLHYIPKVLKDGQVHKFSYMELAKLTLASCANIFGEPPFSIYSKSVLNDFDGATLGGLPVRYLGDVVAPLKASKELGAVGSGFSLGYFRRHADQDSAADSPVLLSGVVEWELISRYLNEENDFDEKTVMLSKNKIRSMYKIFESKFPILHDALGRIDSDTDFKIDPDFTNFYMEARRLQGI